MYVHICSYVHIHIATTTKKKRAKYQKENDDDNNLKKDLKKYGQLKIKSYDVFTPNTRI